MEPNRKRQRVSITLAPDTVERLKQYAFENHIGNGISGAIEDLASNATVKNTQVRGQMSLSDGKGRKNGKSIESMDNNKKKK